MCELNKELNLRSENEAMFNEILAQYGQKNEAEELDPGRYGYEGNDSIYSAEELYAPQELMAVVYLGTN